MEYVQMPLAMKGGLLPTTSKYEAVHIYTLTLCK
jgi:hypothetical protein